MNVSGFSSGNGSSTASRNKCLGKVGKSLRLGQVGWDISPERYVQGFRPISPLGSHSQCTWLSGERAVPRPCAGKPAPWRTPAGTLAGQEAIFMMDDLEDGLRQRVALERGSGGVGADLQAHGRVHQEALGGRFGAQAGKVITMHADSDTDQARADVLCARLVESCQRRQGPVLQVRAPEVPVTVVHGFHVHVDAVATRAADQQVGSLGLDALQEDAAGEVGLAAVDAAPFRCVGQAGTAGGLLGQAVHAAIEEASEVEECIHATVVGGPDIMGRSDQHAVPPALHGTEEEADMGSAFTDEDLQVGLLESGHDLRPHVPSSSGSQQAGQARCAALLGLFEEQWSGPPADTRGLGVRLADAAAALRRWALW